MKANAFINLKRFHLLLKRDFYTQGKSYILGLGAIFCILFIVNVASIASYKYWNFHLVFYPLTLLIGGLIFTSLSFNELSQQQSHISYLIIPASSFEKFISKLIISSIGYVSVSLILYFLLSVFTFFFNSIIFGFAHQVFNPFHRIIWYCIRIYLVVHSIFFLGAIYFRKNSFIKTILSLFGLALTYSIFVIAILFILYFILSFNRHIYFSLTLFNNIDKNGFNFPATLNVIFGILSYFIKTLLWYILAPFLWIITFIHLKETEV